jgi:hypothetical protein
MISVPSLDLEKQTPVVNAVSPELCRRTQHCWTGMQVMVIAVLVSLLALKIAVDIAIEATIFQRLQDRTLTLHA